MPETFEFVNGTFYVHSADKCAGSNCPIHNPSLHGMIEEPMLLRTDSFAFPLIERICHDNKIGHPDPDSVAFLNKYGPEGSRGSWGVHGCDGCCGRADRRSS